ncbi:putative phytoene dehydrogenase [Nitrospina gracilis 3/211]|uniref:Putative phytoene dehydrogenase n=1 Tax=Nitrospina gracilis (strain 3/211) TaxID=1266370 RepID=M1YHV6_NITG3|nr:MULTISPECIES: NAD(P)/FAD-dependent oxidoreductase [Nitrospina]MCF8723047.1 phytoene dehydrogenase-like protein [Nitrospina sp. Nb-3]CCQ90080.1 putative phytoene dehydrogenase [Nitrospina gracilis 3/211]
MVYDALIIGSGLSGLAAGIRLAMFNKKVLIVEKHVEVGGLNSFYVRKQRTFDVGLHAMTNYVPKGARNAPLSKLLKQLRFRHEDFRLCPQHQSEIRFPGHALRFTNDFSVLEEEVARAFPAQIDGFRRLVAKIRDYDELDLNNSRFTPARAVVQECITDPVLIDMLFCPLMYYGSASEGDMDFYQFVIMFKSVFMEGFAKPEGGMPYILNLLVDKYKTLGGELRMGAGVKAIHAPDGALQSVELENGETLLADKVISSAGYIETLRLCRPCPVEEARCEEGRMSFMECLFVLDRQPKDLGYDKSIVFFSTKPRFDYRVPEAAVDVTSGVLCAPNNFDYPQPGEGMLRLTNQANYGVWNDMVRADYRAAKKEWRERAIEEILQFFPDFRHNVVFTDAFTPKTIFKYTGHLNGAVYGAPHKIKDGRTPIRNVFICGTDQGFLGIIGATLSGISMANLHVLQAENKPEYGRI